MTIADAIYALCAGTSLMAAGMLLRQYGARRSRVLLWSSIAFVGIAINNVLVMLDFGVFPGMDLSVVRSFTAALSMTILVYGLIWEAGA
jgi:hypothetical protein